MRHGMLEYEGEHRVLWFWTQGSHGNLVRGARIGVVTEMRQTVCKLYGKSSEPYITEDPKSHIHRSNPVNASYMTAKFSYYLQFQQG